MTLSSSQVNHDLVAGFPQDWEIVHVSEIAENHDNKRQPIKSTDREHMRGQYPYCGANGVVDHIDRYKLDGEYVLVAEDGGYWGKGENTAYIMRGKFFVNNHAHILKAIEDKTSNNFLMLMLNYMNIDPLIGGDARGKLTKSVLSNLPFPLPPLLEQKSITRVLTTVQDAIAEQERLIEKLKELKRSMMHHLFTHGTKGEKTKMTDIGEIPESWEITRVKDFGRVVTGNTPSTKVAHYYGGNIKLISPADLTGAVFIETAHRQLTEKGLAVARSVPKNSVLVGCIGNVGKIGITRDEVTSFNQQINAVVPNDSHDHLFVYYLLSHYKGVLESKASKVTLPILNKSNFENIAFYVPGITEQKAISGALFTVDQRILTTQSVKGGCEKLFKTLLHELMSGERRIKL